MNIPVRKLDKTIESDLAVKENDIPKVIIDRKINDNIQIKLPGSQLPSYVVRSLLQDPSSQKSFLCINIVASP